MTTEQRIELLERVSNDDPDKKIALKDCIKIAKDLNLSVEQVCINTVVVVVIILFCLCCMILTDFKNTEILLYFGKAVYQVIALYQSSE